MGSTGLYLNGNEIGKVSWSFDGSKATIWASCPYEENYIYRLNILAGEEKILLGVMMPRGDLFAIKAVLSQEQYKQLLKAGQSGISAQVWRNLPGEKRALPLPFALSELMAVPHGFALKDRLLNKQIGCKDKILYKRWEQSVYLVFQMEMGREMLFLPFFCFITPVLADSRVYGAICLDPNEIFLPIVQ